MVPRSASLVPLGRAIANGAPLSVWNEAPFFLMTDPLCKVFRRSPTEWLRIRIYHEEGLAVHGVDPVVGSGTQTQALTRHIVFGQCFGRAVVDAHMTIDVKNGCLVRRFQHPLLAQRGAPGKRLFLIGQMLELDAQGAHFWSAIEAQQFAPFSGRVVAQRLD